MYLLDTHTLLWWLGDADKLSPAQHAVLSDPDAVVLLSAVTVWEITIKQSLGKLTIPKDFWQQVAAQGFHDVPISAEHARGVGTLPDLHQDPFDRLLIAQTKCESCVLLTSDSQIKRYKVECL